MTDVHVEWIDIDRLVAAIIAKAEAGPEAAKQASHTMSLSFIAAAKRNATGPARIAGRERRTRAKKGQPSRTLSWGAGGPGVVTGFMRNSIQVRTDTGGGGHWETTVHPSGPYYRRLEFGFTGTDSIGRRYAQPPYPFLRPALDTAHRIAYRRLAVKEFRRVITAA